MGKKLSKTKTFVVNFFLYYIRLAKNLFNEILGTATPA